MSTTSTSTSTLTTVSFVNLVGIFVSVVLVIMYLVFSGHALKYIKTFACKIKVIANRAEDQNIQLKDYNYQPARSHIRSTPGYLQLEAVFKNEVNKSRSLHYKNIVGAYMAKYNHVVHYPFRDKISDRINLLKPKSTFFNLIFVTQLCIVWMTTIMLSAILQNAYTDISSVAVGMFVGLTVLISIIASVLNAVQINRLQHLYVLNIKNSFKTEREQCRFVQLQGDHNKLRNYSPENSLDEAEFKKHLADYKKTKNSNQYDQSHMGGASLTTSRTMARDENNTLHSSRKLLFTDDNDKTKNQMKNFNVPNKSIIMEDGEGEDYEYEDGAYSQSSAIKLKSAIPPNQEYQSYNVNEMDISRTSNRDTDLYLKDMQKQSIYDKYAFIEDTHAIGEQHLLQNEAFKGENLSNVLTFGIIFIIIALACIICCYLNYTFPALLSKYIFFMFVGAFLMDMLVFRMLIVLLMAAVKYFMAKKKGYQQVKYSKPEEIKQLLGSTIAGMMRKQKSHTTPAATTGHDLLVNPSNYLFVNSSNDLKFKHKLSIDGNEYENQTQGGYERHDTTMKQFNAEDHKEDEYAQEIDENGFKKADQYGPNKLPQHDSYISNNPLMKNSEVFESPLKSTQGQLQLTQFSLLKGLQNTSDKQENEQLMDQKQIINELVDYNLLLFRMIYDAYDERGEKVLNKFRSDDHSVLRKRYMLPILNPSYDHESWLKDQLKNKPIEETGGEFEDVLDPEQQLSDKDSSKIEPVVQELADDPKSSKVERLHIDKFGNLLSDKPSEVMVTLPNPEYGVISSEKELSTGDEDADEWSKKLKELKMLRDKKNRGEQLTDTESKRLSELETEEDIYRHKEIEDLQSLKEKRTDEQNLDLKNLLKEEEEYRNRRIEELQSKEKNHKINEEEKKELKRLLEWQNEQKKKLLEELRLKKENNQLTEEEARMLKQLEEEEWSAKKSELEELREKLKRGTLTEEEKRRLQQLEEEETRRNMSEMEELLEKLKNGTITEEERKRLLELQEWEKNVKNKQLEELREKLKKGTLTEEEKRVLNKMEEEERNTKLSELEMLRQKRENGELTEEEMRRLEELEEWEHIQRMKEIEELQSKKHKTTEEIERLKQLQNEEDIRVDQKLQDLYEKLVRGEHLTEEEMRKLKELEEYKHKRLVDQIEELLAQGDDISDHDKLKLLHLQRELLKLELEQIKRKNSDLTEEEQARVKLLEENIDKLEYEYLLLKKEIDTLSSWEEDRLRELEARLKMNDLSEIDNDQNAAEEDTHLFEEQNMLNEQQQMMNDESYMKTEEAESRITDNDNFADLPPVEVIGSIKKPKSSESQRQKGDNLIKRHEEVEKLNESERVNEVEKQNENYSFKEEQVVGNEQVASEKHQEKHKSERITSAKSEQRVHFDQKVEEQDNKSARQGLDENEKLLKKGEKGYEEQQSRIEAAKQKHQSAERRHSCSEYGLDEDEKLLKEGEDGYEEQQERVSTSKTGLRQGEKILKEDQEGYDEQQERMKTAQSKYRDHLKLEEERHGLEENEKLLKPGEQGYEDQQERMRMAKNGGLRDGEKLLQKGEKGYEEQQQRINSAKKHHHVQPSQEDEHNKSQDLSHREQHSNEMELVDKDNSARAENLDSSRGGLNESEKLLQKSEKGYEEQQNRINSAMSQKNDEQMRQTSSRHSNRSQQLERLQSAKSRQSVNKMESVNSAHSNSYQQNRSENQSQYDGGHKDEEKVLNPGEAGFEQQQERIKSAISQRRADLHSALSGLRDGERLLKPGEQGYEEQQQRLQQSQRSGKKSIVSEQERIKSAISNNRSHQQQRLDSEGAASELQLRPATSQSSMRNQHQEAANSLRSMSSRQQDRNNSKVHPHSGIENYDRGVDNEMQFGHDDLEIGEQPARGANELPPDESIYSHKTSTILDEEKVSFMHIEHLPDQDQASDDSFAEQDMVYYNKDDLTNYSKGLGLNKVKAKPQQQQQQHPQYYSENDIQEVQEGSISEEELNESRSLDAKNRKRMGRGKIQHNEHEIQSYNDNIDGRLKVDSWNLNYNGKNKKHRKKKIDQSVQRRMDALQNIYGVDAKTLAGVNKAKPAPMISGGFKANKDGTLGSSRVSDNMSFGSTQNTFFRPGGAKNNLKSNKGSALDINSNLFSSNGFTGKGAGGLGMSKRWNDIESTLKGGKLVGNNNNNQQQKQSQQQQQYSPSDKLSNQSNRLFSNQGKKLTATQQKFNNPNQSNILQEESKSRSNSRTKSNNRMQSSSLKKGLNKKAIQQKIGPKGSQGYDDYSESDEGVNDQNALFQRRDVPQAWTKDKPSNAINKGGRKKQKQQTIIDNEIDHDESDEGVHDHDPDFQANNPLFEKRGFDLSHQRNENKHQTMKINQNRNNSQGSDLEKQDGGFMRGRAGGAPANQTTKYDASNLGRVNGRNSNLSDGSKSLSPTKPPIGGGQRKNKAGQKQSLPMPGLGYNNDGSRRQNRGSYDANENRQRSIGSGGAINKQKGNNKQNQNRMVVDNNNNGSDNQGDDDDQFIVGPESNHSMIQSRKDFNKQKRNSLDDENVGYLSIHRDRQASNYDSSKSPDKKRNVRRAAHSTSEADEALNKLQKMKNQRLKKSQMLAENALFDKQDAEDSTMKKKRKKQQKDSVRKEVNYWLDYDSPYAEYLVARFREWSPNVKPVQSRGGDSSERQQASGKYKEIQNVYAKEDPRHGGTHHQNKKNSSISPNRNGVMNLTSNSIGNESVQVLGQKKRTQKKNSTSSRNMNQQAVAHIQDQASKNRANSYEVEDYEEP